MEKGGKPAIINYLGNLKDAIFKTLIMFRFISHSQRSQVENTVMEKPKTYYEIREIFQEKRLPFQSDHFMGEIVLIHIFHAHMLIE